MPTNATLYMVFDSRLTSHPPLHSPLHPLYTPLRTPLPLPLHYWTSFAPSSPLLCIFWKYDYNLWKCNFPMTPYVYLLVGYNLT